MWPSRLLRLRTGGAAGTGGADPAGIAFGSSGTSDLRWETPARRSVSPGFPPQLPLTGRSAVAVNNGELRISAERVMGLRPILAG